MTLEKIVKSPEGRIKRANIRSGKLHVRGKDPAYEYRIVNDVDDRVLSFKETGYEIVEDKDVVIGSKRVDTPSQQGAAKLISVGGGTKAVLMRQKREWYEEDQADKHRSIAELEAQSKQKALDGNYGELKTVSKNRL